VSGAKAPPFPTHRTRRNRAYVGGDHEADPVRRHCALDPPQQVDRIGHVLDDVDESDDIERSCELGLGEHSMSDRKSALSGGGLQGD
jgi:hypothetical protein